MPLSAEFIAQQEQSLVAKLGRYREWTIRDAKEGEITPRVQQKIMVAVPHIRAALRAIENGTYGTCTECEEPIPMKRLEAVPGATRCVSCQK